MTRLKEQAKRENWQLADSFYGAIGYPKVGETAGSFTILKAWVDRRNILKAYKVQCTCGAIHNMFRCDKIKNRTIPHCAECDPRLKASRYPDLYAKWGPEKTDWLLVVWGRCRGRSLRIDYATMDPVWFNDAHKFVNDLAPLPGSDDKTLEIDRIDTNKGYEPGNIRFILRRHNARNRTDTQYVSYHGNQVPFMAFIEQEFGFKTVREAGKLYGHLMHKFKAQNWKDADKLIKQAQDRPDVWPTQLAYEQYTSK